MSTTELTSQEEKAKLWAELDAGEQTPAAETPEATPAATEPTAPTERAAAEPAAVEQGADDQFAGWPDAAKHEVLGMRAQMEQVLSRLRNAEGHIGGLNSQLKQQAQKAAQAVREDGGDAPTQAQVREAGASPERMRKLKEEYPEFGSAMEGALNEALDRFAATNKAAPVADAPAGVTREELLEQIADLKVESSHKGWRKTVATPAFAGWLQTQAREVQMLAGSSDPQDAVRLLDLHKAAAEQGREIRTQRQASAAAIPMGRSGAVRSKPVDQMTKAELWQHLDQLDAQKG